MQSDCTQSVNHGAHKFLRRGDEVECVLPEPAEDEADAENVDRQSLRNTLHEIRELETRLRPMVRASDDDADSSS